MSLHDYRSGLIIHMSMHHVDPDNHRQLTLIRAAIYGVFAVLLTAATVLFVLAAQGYDYDRNTGEIIHNGLVMLKTKPVAADIYINGSREDGETPARLPLPEGLYDIELRAKGYQTWQHQVKVIGSSIHWFDYPLLITDNPQTSIVKSYTRPGLSTQSPDQKTVLVQRGTRSTVFDRYTIGEQISAPVPLQLPTSLYEAAGDPFAVMEWADDNRHVLLRQTVKGKAPNYVLLDTQRPAQSLKLGIRRGVSSEDSQVWLRDGDWDRLLVLSVGTLREVDLTGGEAAQVLARRVLTANGHDDQVYTAVQKARAVEVRRLTQDGHVVIYSTPKLSSALTLQADSYKDQTRLVIWDESTGVVNVLPDPDKASAGLIRSSGVTQLDEIRGILFAPGGQFLLVNSAKKAVVFDFENDKKYIYHATFGDTTTVSWLDQYRLSVVASEKLAIVDFDGYNEVIVNASAADRSGYLNEDKTFLISMKLRQKSGRYVLEQTNLVK